LQKDIHTGKEHLEVAFEFRKMRFVYHEATNAFERLKFPVHEPFQYYLKATGVLRDLSVRAYVCLGGCAIVYHQVRALLVKTRNVYGTHNETNSVL
jgi:hypothetical protein